MLNSLKIVGFFVLGLIMGRLRLLPDFLLENDLSVYALYALLILVGLLVGMDRKSLEVLRGASWQLLLVPVSTALGTYAGVIAVSFLVPDLKLSEVLAIGSGFGYYSLSSILIAELKNEALGVIALLSNIFRELITLLLTPVFVRFFSPLAPILSGGATSMDTTLPVITEFSGKDYAIVAIFNGLVLSLSVPFLVTFFCGF